MFGLDLGVGIISLAPLNFSEMVQAYTGSTLVGGGSILASFCIST